MEHPQGEPRISWFGEKRLVRLMLLAALLTLGVIHFESVVNGIIFLWQIAQPLVMGVIMAYILEIVVKLLEGWYFPHFQKKWVHASRRWVCILLAMVLAFSLVVLVVQMVIPGLMDAFTLLAREVPRYYTELKNWALDQASAFPALEESIQNLELDWENIQQRIINYAMKGLGGILSSTVTVISVVAGSVINFFLSVIFALFLLLGKNRLRTQYERLLTAFLPARRRDKLHHITAIAHKAFSGFIIGQSTNGLILGAATWLGMLIFQMPYALIVGVLSGVTALIPIIGGYIGAILGAFLVFTVNPVQAIWFLIFIIILQQISGNLVYPRLLGSSVGLPGMWVLAAVTIGGGLGGIGGMLLGVPLLATAYTLLRDEVRDRNQAAKPAKE